jgi:hypothetical protein
MMFIMIIIRNAYKSPRAAPECTAAGRKKPHRTRAKTASARWEERPRVQDSVIACIKDPFALHPNRANYMANYRERLGSKAK